ncbi:PEGA domain-containing protein [Candidatus Woesearchaeota archaeon]|nr:PEGA domain-containing protein [Candidatus Woesearchaeota archaeon]
MLQGRLYLRRIFLLIIIALSFLSISAVVQASHFSRIYQITGSAIENTTASSKPDLTVPFIVYTPQSITEGDSVLLTANFKNTGQANSGGFAYKWYLDNAEAGSGTNPGIGAGLTWNEHYSWKATAGTHSIKLVIDSNSQVDESNEANNEYAVTVTPAGKITGTTNVTLPTNNATPAACTDSDVSTQFPDGINIYAKGSVTASSGTSVPSANGTSYTSYDNCLYSDPSYSRDTSFCNQLNCYVNEFYCAGPAGGAKTQYVKTIKCDYGCKDGECFAASQPGWLYFNSNTPEVSIYIDNSFRGLTPINLTLSSGSHALKATKQGYNDDTSDVYVTSFSSLYSGIYMTQASQGSTTCTDSDGGKTYGTYGTVTECSSQGGAGSNGSCFSLNDFCSGSMLSEYFCYANSSSGREAYQCQNGCGSGACVSSTPLPLPPPDAANNTADYSVQLAKGWNLLSPASLGVSPSTITNTDCSMNELTLYSYFPTESKYGRYELVSAGQSSYVLNGKTDKDTELLNKYSGSNYMISTNANSWWAISKKNCKITGTMKGEIVEPGFLKKEKKLVKGWNFISITPDVVGHNLNEIKGTCKITKAYTFDQQVQDWEPVTDSGFPTTSLGYGMILNTTSECNLKPAAPPSPQPDTCADSDGGKTYGTYGTVTECSSQGGTSSNGSCFSLNDFCSGSQKSVLGEGETKNINAGGKNYDVIASFIGADGVVLTVNGALTDTLKKGDSYLTGDGARITTVGMTYSKDFPTERSVQIELTPPNSMLNEYFCYANSSSGREAYQCQNGCSSGACNTLSKGTLNINSNPQLANVYVDAAYSGQTPLTVSNLPAQDHTVRISKQGYEDYETTVAVPVSGELKIDATLNTAGAFMSTDLSVLYIGESKSGNSITFTAYVKNNGNAASSQAAYKWYVDGAEIKTGILSQLEPNIIGSASTTWTRQSGYVASYPLKHKVKFAVSASDKRRENNEREDYVDALSVKIFVKKGTYDKYTTGGYTFEERMQHSIDRANQMFEEAIYKSSPNGILERFRIEGIEKYDSAVPAEFDSHLGVDLAVLADEGGPRLGYLPYPNYNIGHNFLIGGEGIFSDDGERALVHEMGHYRDVVHPYIASIDGSKNAVNSVAYTSKYDGDVMNWYWSTAGFSEYSAGVVNKYLGQGSPPVAEWADFNVNGQARSGFLWKDIPAQNRIRVMNNGAAVSGAQISVYRSSGTFEVGGQSISASSILSGTTDSSGYFSLGQPFDSTNSDWGKRGTVLLIKITSSGQAKYKWLEIFDFNLAYWAGDAATHTFELELGCTTPRDDLTITKDTTLCQGTYTLTDSNKDGIIKIAANNLILDCGGAIISGPAISPRQAGDSTRSYTVNNEYTGIGISVIERNGVEIRNCNIQKYRYGILARDSKIINIHHNTLSNNFDNTGTVSGMPYRYGGWLQPWDFKNGGGGALLQRVENSVFMNNPSRNQMIGISLLNSRNIKINNNDLSRNTGAGIYMSGSTYNDVHNNNIDYGIRTCESAPEGGCDAAGILIEEGSSYNEIASNSMKFGGDGYFARANTNLNGQTSIPPSIQNNYNIVKDNDGSYSPHNAFEATFSVGNKFISNKASNSGYGFWLGFSSSMLIENNEINSNGNGIDVEHGHGTTINNNRINNNQQAAINLRAGNAALRQYFPSSNYVISYNQMTGNGQNLAATDTTGITQQT